MIIAPRRASSKGQELARVPLSLTPFGLTQENEANSSLDKGKPLSWDISKGWLKALEDRQASRVVAGAVGGRQLHPARGIASRSPGRPPPSGEDASGRLSAPGWLSVRLLKNQAAGTVCVVFLSPVYRGVIYIE